MSFVPSASALTLSDVISLSVQNHPAVKSSESLKGAAQAEVDGAWQNFLPTPSATYNTNSQGGISGGDGSNRSSTIALQQPMWWFSGTQKPVYEAAQARLVGSEAGIYESRDDLAKRALNAYGSWLSSNERINVAQRDLVYYEGLLDQIGRRVESGASAGVEQELVISRRLGTQGILAASQAGSRSALEQLAQLTGDALSDDELLSGKTSAPVLPGQEELLRQSLVRNPTLQRLDAEIKALGSEVQARREVIKPQLYLRAENTWQEDIGSDNNLQIGVQWSPGAGLSSWSAVRGAAEKMNAAQFSKDSAQRQIKEQVGTAYAQYQGTYERLKLQMDSFQALVEIRESYLRQFMAGRRQWQEVMNTVRDVSDAQYTIADLRASLLVSGYQVLLLANGDSGIADAQPLGISSGDL